MADFGFSQIKQTDSLTEPKGTRMFRRRGGVAKRGQWSAAQRGQPRR